MPPTTKVKKQGKGTVKVNAFDTFVPAGVAACPTPVKTKLIKNRKRKKK